MRAGQYNQIVDVLRKTIEEGDYTDKEVWKPVYHTKAGVRHNAGGRNIENQEIFFTDTVDFTLRYYVDVQDEDHILWDGREYRILNIFRNFDSTFREINIKTELINK